MENRSNLGEFARRNAKAILFIVAVLCLGGGYSALKLPSSVFPQTDFPRVVILVDNGVMPADEMMARVTRPIEEAMKDVPGALTVRTTTGRGSADVNVFFSWKADMVQSELYVLSRLSQIKSSLPTTATYTAYRLTFSAFPVIGISLTSKTRSLRDLWETARYVIKPRFLRVPGVARVDLVGGRTPEYHVVVDPTRMRALNVSLPEITAALTRGNLVASAGMHEEKHTLYLAVVDGRTRTPEEIERLSVVADGTRVVRIGDFARVVPGQEPVFNVVTAEGTNAVLLNVRSQPDGSTLAIADALKEDLKALRQELPPDHKLSFFYDQSILVRASVQSVWESIGFGLILSIGILFLFLKRASTTMVAVAVIPAAVLVTLLVLRLAGLTFNLMTLGGIAAAVGLIIDDAIVVVEAIHTKIMMGRPRSEAVSEAVSEILKPLIGSTIGPVLVFVPLAFLDGVPGVFFRALAITMVVSLLASLLLAVTLTPSLAAWVLRARTEGTGESLEKVEEGGVVLRQVVRVYEGAARVAFGHPLLTFGVSGLVFLGGIALYQRLKTDFLPEMDEGGFVIDYVAPAGTSLAETDRSLLEVEKILRATPEVESYSRRTGAALGFHLVEPNTGDFLVKLKGRRERKTDEVISSLRRQLKESQPHIEWEFPGILSDLIGDLTWSPEPIEIKIFSTDLEFLKKKAPQIKELISTQVKGVVDAKSGLIVAGPSLSVRVRSADAQRFGLDADAVAQALNTAMLGQTASSVLEADRIVEVRVRVDSSKVDRMASLGSLPLRSPGGAWIQLSQVADITEDPGQLELRREDLRQNVAVTARLEGRDLGSAIQEIREKLSRDPSLPAGVVEYGGLYHEQQESFRNLMVVLVMAILLVFTALLIEFRSLAASIAIVFGAVLSLFGTVLALLITGTSLNIISILGAIIGIGIVHKNGILMLDFVEHFRLEEMSLEEALIRSGRRRLRPVLMTSMAAALGMLPLAYGLGSGADMLKPLAISVIGALCISVLLSLVATPTVFLILSRLGNAMTSGNSPTAPN